LGDSHVQISHTIKMSSTNAEYYRTSITIGSFTAFHKVSVLLLSPQILMDVMLVLLRYGIRNVQSWNGVSWFYVHTMFNENPPIDLKLLGDMSHGYIDHNGPNI